METKRQFFPPPFGRNGKGQHSQWLELSSWSGRKLSLLLVLLLMAVTGAKADGYITDVMVIGSSGDNLRSQYANNGWTVVGQDLNKGVKNSWYIYLCYKTSATANPQTGYITDIIASTNNKSSITYNGRIYYKVPNNSGWDGDLNKEADGAFIYLYATKDRANLSGNGGTKRVITKLTTSSSATSTSIQWRETYSGACDANKNAGGDWIFMNMTFAEQTLVMNNHPTFASSLVFNGSAQTLVTKVPSGNYGIMKYSVDGGSWTTNLPTATTVGNHTVKYYLDGGTYANNSSQSSKTVTINPPVVAATNLAGVFDQLNKKVNLSWSVGTIPGNYTDYKWVVYRGSTKIATLNQNVRTYADTGFTNESTVEYSVYYVSDFWDVDTKRDDTKATVTVYTTRKVPVNGLKAESQPDRIVFTWTSDGYPLNWGNKFNIYVDNETEPIYTLTPTDNQTSFQWEHRTTDKHSDRQSGVSGTVHYTEEPLNGCEPHNYRVEGVIGGKKLNEASISRKAIGNGTLFYSFDATKGAFPGTVKLSWHVDVQGSTDAKTYIVDRRRTEKVSEPWVTLHRSSSNEEYLFYTDDTPLPGVYYDYRVTVQDKCADGTIISNETTDIGFAQTTGTVSGRVTYGSTGSSVAGVDVIAKKTGSASESDQQYHAMRFTADNGAVTWSYPSTTYAAETFNSADFSIQMWIAPDAFSDSRVVRLNDNYSFGFNTSGNLLFRNGTTETVFALTLKKGVYNHVALTRSGNTLTCYLVERNEDGIPTVKKSAKELAGNLSLGEATLFELGGFKGHVDEFRLWTKCLTEAEITENYDHLLVGNEKNLETYWTFDEGLRTQFFDYSRDGTVYHQHHGKIGSNTESSTTTPEDLALKAKTDRDGNYIIQGIPFSGEGTTYAVIPALGIHVFNPTQQLRFVCNNSLVHNSVDFNDISSFPVSGTVYYAGTDYPVEGVNFYVDGTICSKDGEVITTSADGTYEISVPIGDHFITVVKSGHVFAENGRYPADTQGAGIKHNFNQKMKDIDFYDETLVNFTGRVVGGSIQGNKPVGFGQSDNNIGVTEFVLTPLNDIPRMNVVKVVSETTFSYDTNPDTVGVASATSAINSKVWRGAGKDDCRKFFVHTDSLTGEFSAMLPPLQYNVSDMKVVKSGLTVGSATTIDLTNPNITLNDTLYSEDGSGYELYEYNTMLKQTYHCTPSFTVKQQGREDGSFGIDSFELEDELGKLTISDIYEKDADGNIIYKYGGPLFIKEDPYTFIIEGFEEYTNADNGAKDHVALKGNTVTISNALSADQRVYVEDGTVNGESVEAGQVVELKSNELTLDDNGKATYKWLAGLPNIADPYTRTISIYYDIDGKTNDWEGNGMEGIVLGSLPTGNNFMTAGPDKLLMVLRDPPGTGSSATWTSGESITRSDVKATTFSEDFQTTFNHKFGLHTETIVGTPGAGDITVAEAKDDLTAGFKIQATSESSKTSTYVTTTTTEISTSGEPDYVGDQGDVFIGTATNIIFGKARNLGFTRSGNGVELSLKEIMTTGLSFGTSFNYTRSYIENTLFPNWELKRENLLKTVENEDSIKNFVNNTDHVVYLTTLKPGDENFGMKDTYTAVAPKTLKENTVYADSVVWVNTQIDNWKKYLEQNEEAKVKAFNQRDKYLKKNYSFDAGSTVTYTIEKDTTSNHTNDWTCAAGIVAENTFGFEVRGIGLECTISDETIAGTHETHERDTLKVTSFSYTLAEEGIDAISVDVYNYDQYGPIFRTRGGQTCNPYEGEVVTEYYEPGTIIMEGTMQIEVPKIGVDVNEISDVPTGSAANYTLQLSNQSEIGADVAYKLFVLDETNPDGAQLTVDGKVLTEGRLIKVPANQTLSKALQLRQTNTSILDYEGMNAERLKDNPLYKKGIGVVFASDSQPEDIADTIFIKAHFVPSSSDVMLALSNTTLNTQTGSDLVLTFSGFDRNYHNLKAFRLQYKKQGATDWTLLKEYVLNEADLTNNNLELPPSGASVSYTLPMESYSDGNYTFRVVSVATYGADEVYKYSNEIALVKDMMRPRPMGQPEPTDGVLDIGDELSVTFNEAILKGELTKAANFKVTGVLNGAEVDHATALQLTATTAATATTDASINLAQKDFSIDAWVNISDAGTILSHGKGVSKMTVSTNSSNKLEVKIGDNTYTSSEVVPTGKWAFLSLSYQAVDGTGSLSASVADDANETTLFSKKAVAAYEGNGPLAVGGGSNAAIHELLLWDEAHDMTTALMKRSKTKAPSTRHLIGYWKMNEGEGKEIRDYARNRHLTMANETWYMNNVNKAISLDGMHCVGINTSDLNTFIEDDNVIEFWMRGSKQTAEAQLLQMGDVALWTNTAGELQLTGKNAYKSVEQTESYATNSGNILDDVWHHIALNILRQGAAAVYVDGKRVLATNATNVGAINTDRLILGAHRVYDASVGGSDNHTYDRAFTGQVDEVRVWSATLNADLIAKNRKVRLTGSEDGLVAYYPFEKKELDSGNQVQTVGNDADFTGSGHTAQLLAVSNSAAGTLSYTDTAPALREKLTETNVGFTFVASDEKVVINIDEDAATIEGCTLNFTVLDLRDENGNYSDPVVWSAFVNRKQLVWAEDKISVEHQLNSSSSVTATLVNKGGQQQLWTLSGLPAWITTTSESGQTNPLAETAITFDIAPSAPLGRHEVTVYVTGNDNIDVPLILNVKVKSEEPLWVVDNGNYEETMNVIGTLQVIGVTSQDEDDIIGAFIGNECRGVAKLEYKQRYDGYFVTMDIYGNTSENDKSQLEFKVFDASAGIIYPVVTTTYVDPESQQSVTGPIKFKSNEFYGSYKVPVEFNATDEIEQNIDLGKGWNWISLSVKPDDMSPDFIFAKAEGKATTVKSSSKKTEYDEEDEEYPWFGSLHALNNKEMYLVRSTEDFTLNVTGHRVNPQDEPITIIPKWNWLGYNGQQVINLNEALSSMTPKDGDVIKGQRGVAYYDEYEWIGSLHMLTPGKGYKMKSSAEVNRTLTYPSSASTSAAGARATSFEDIDGTSCYSKVFTPVDYRNYAENMVLIAQVVRDGIPVSGAELGVFAGEECREAAVTDGRGLVIVTVPGDAATSLSFLVSDGSDVYYAGESVSYKTDDVIGTPRAPFVIELSNATGIEPASMASQRTEQVYDLQGRKVKVDDQNYKLRKGVYIVNGKKQVK